MSTNIFVEVPYRAVLKVNAAQLEFLLSCPLYTQEYMNNNYVYKEMETENNSFQIYTASGSKVIPLGDTVSIEIQDILAENNRLARENEKLLKQLNEQVKVSTELVNAIS